MDPSCPVFSGKTLGETSLDSLFTTCQQFPLRDLHGCSWTKSRQQPIKTMAGVRLIHLILSIVGRILSLHITKKRMSTGGCGCLAFTSPNMGPTVLWNYRIFKELFSINSNLFWKDKNQDAKLAAQPKIPTASMYGIASYIYHKKQPFMYVGKYTIRGWWGNGKLLGKFKVDTFGVSSVRWRLQIEWLRKGGARCIWYLQAKLGCHYNPQKFNSSQLKNDGKERLFSGASCQISGKYTTGWWFQPLWKILGLQIGSFPQVRVKIKNVWNHHLNNLSTLSSHVLFMPTEGSCQEHRDWSSKTWDLQVKKGQLLPSFLGTIFDLRDPPTFWVDWKPEVPFFCRSIDMIVYIHGSFLLQCIFVYNAYVKLQTQNVDASGRDST